MKSLLNKISSNQAVTRFLNGDRGLMINDILSLSYLICASFYKKKQNYSIVAPNLYVAQNIYEQISAIIGEENCLLYPVDEIFYHTNYSYSKEMLAQRLYVMDKCLDGQNRILITHVNAVQRILPSPKIYLKNTIVLRKNERYVLNEIINKLNEMSFLRVNKVDQSLQYALRGDILDIFPINAEKPLRIEFFDDEIESIREFDIGSQISSNNLEEVKIFPATDLLIDNDLNEGIKRIKDKLEIDKKNLSYEFRDKLSLNVNKDIDEIEYQGFNENLYRYFHFFQEEYFNIFDYFNSNINILFNKTEIDNGLELRYKEKEEQISELYNNGLSLNDKNYDLSLSSSLSRNRVNIDVETYSKNNESYTLNIKSIPFFSRSLINSINLIKEYNANSKKVVICLANNKAYQEFLTQNEIEFEVINKQEEPSSLISICDEDLKTGFELVDENIVFLSKREILGYKQSLTVFSSRYKKASIINSFEELNVGDYVVHEENGIGRYEGIVTLEANEQILDYLKITYANEQILYIPLQKFSSIRKYVSREGVVPRLSRMGGKDWANTKEKIKEHVNFLADRLINLYAQREQEEGFAFKKDDEFQEEFENAFPYELTKDQDTAINEIKADMEKKNPMDRLLCGDVGFGKTEVAFRAAFKAMLSNKQVALLCPTTILAKQHYDVAKSRFAMFGVKIALFSRFVSEKQQKEYIEQIKNNEIHLIIGTHRLLSKDINIPNLGLLIVDEEQRFGVEHKERIKEISVNIDVLTLTATPIPRTLQMSLLGIRNLSQLKTPPHARMPIQTYVTPYNFKLAKEAISRELSRGGQVFYLHNRVATIRHKVDEIQKELPNARIGLVHAKMDKDDIDMIMTEFYLGNIDVLVCTSIIEAGLDVPNANTIIVENADLFGLSQLYQIKGRVGRSNRVAYAYLFFNPKKDLNVDAEKRLSAIKEFAELGSGFKIAQKDLSIRGAGDILGSEQSGFIDTVGIDMYVNILSEVINERKGIKNDDKKIKTTNISIGGYIPSDYAIDSDKIQLYQEIESCQTISALELLKRKIRDIYGKIPKEVLKIITKRKIDILSNHEFVESVFEGENIVVTLTKEASMMNGFANLLSYKLSILRDELNIKFINKQFIIKLNKSKNLVNNLLVLLESINTLDTKAIF